MIEVVMALLAFSFLALIALQAEQTIRSKDMRRPIPVRSGSHRG